MKRLLIIGAGLLAMAHVHAQDGTGIIKVNPMGWFAGQYQLGYEHFLSEKVSVQLLPGAIFSTTSLGLSDGNFISSYSATRSGFIVIPEFRYYLSDETPDGVYVAPFGRFRSVTTKVDEDPQSTRRREIMGGGFVLGYQHQLANGLAGEVFIGPQFKSSSQSYTGAYEQYDDLDLGESDGTGIRFGLNVGFGF